MGLGEPKEAQLFGPYVSESIMSYCRDRETLELPDGDIQTLRNYYGYPLAIIQHGPPRLSNKPELVVSIAGIGIDSYRYKIGRDGEVACDEPEGYSYSHPLSKAIRENTRNYGDAPMRLCVIGVASVVQEEQTLASYSSWYWVQDFTAPRPKIENNSPHEDLLALYLDEDVVRLRYKFGHDIDCQSSTGYSSFVDYKQTWSFMGLTETTIIPIRIYLTDSKINRNESLKVCVIGEDEAGNQQALSHASEFIW